MSDGDQVKNEAGRPAGRPAVVCVNSWAGRLEHPCRVVCETPTRWRIEVDAPTLLPPRNRELKPGEQRLVPKSAVRFLGKAGG